MTPILKVFLAGKIAVASARVCEANQAIVCSKPSFESGGKARVNHKLNLCALS